MAASFLPAPGTKHGPCEPDCFTQSAYNTRPLKPGGGLSQHKDCEMTRLQAHLPCRICRKGIGYEVRVYADPEDLSVFVHAACFERQHDR